MVKFKEKRGEQNSQEKSGRQTFKFVILDIQRII